MCIPNGTRNWDALNGHALGQLGPSRAALEGSFCCHDSLIWRHV